MKKTILLLSGVVILSGCPKQVNQGKGVESNLSASSKGWGIPIIRTVTGGFNGSPSSQVGEPSNSSK